MEYTPSARFFISNPLLFPLLLFPPLLLPPLLLFPLLLESDGFASRLIIAETSSLDCTTTSSCVAFLLSYTSSAAFIAFFNAEIDSLV